MPKSMAANAPSQKGRADRSEAAHYRDGHVGQDSDASASGDLLSGPGTHCCGGSGPNLVLEGVEEFPVGTRHREPNRVLATVLSTNIVGSPARRVGRPP